MDVDKVVSDTQETKQLIDEGPAHVKLTEAQVRLTELKDAIPAIDPDAIRAEALREERGRCEDIVCALWPNKDAIRFAILAGGPEEREAEPCSECAERKGAPPCEFCGPPAWEAYRDGGEVESMIREAAADRVRAALLSAPRDGMTRAYAASLAVDAVRGRG